MEHNYFRPNYIRTYSDLTRIVKLNLTEESTVLDFKQQINFSTERKNPAEELALDICQFANSWGGVLLVGVSEVEDKERGKKIADQFVGILDYEDTSRFINNSVLPLIHPKNLSVSLSCIETPDRKQLMSINVFPLLTGVACVCKSSPPYAAKYPYRTHYGKQYLHPLDVEKRMVDNHRIIPIKLYELMEYSRIVELYPNIKKEPIDKIGRVDSQSPNIVLKEILNNEYRLNISGIDVNIPFSLTRDIWLTERGNVGILLHVGLSISSDRKCIIFDFN